MTDETEILEELEEEANEYDVDIEELTVVPESEVEELRESAERLAELEDEVEELQQEAEEAARIYAEQLSSDDSLFGVDEYVDKFTVEELRDKYQNAVEEGLIEELAPNPRSGDDGINGGVDPTANGGSNENEPEELSSDDQQLLRSMKNRGGEWAEIADEIAENGE